MIMKYRILSFDDYHKLIIRIWRPPLMSIEKGLQSSKRWIATLYTLLYIRVKITLSNIHLWKLITVEPTLQPYLLQRSSRPCSYRQPEHSEADRHRRPESTWQLRESSYQRSNRDPLPYHR